MMTVTSIVTSTVTFADYAAARRYLDTFIPTPTTPNPPDRAHARSQALMAHLGDPQNRVPVIHLAGTSGKGSTATLLAALLQAHGLRVGLGLSPHVRTLLERVQVDRVPISEPEFCRVLGEIAPAIEATRQGSWGAPTFFEIIIALSYTHFAQGSTDVVVMETGLGGRYDATNTVANPDKIAVITPIDFDHTEFLGNTLVQIAGEKAAIIHPHNAVFTLPQAPAVTQVLEAVCQAQQAHLTTVDPAAMLHHVVLSPDSTRFDLMLDPQQPTTATVHDVRLPLPGAYQTMNVGLATAVARAFLQRLGRDLDGDRLREAFASVTLPGRMERRTWRGRGLILDGAHNPQKMQALCTTLATLYPDQRLDFVVALKQDKDYAAVLRQLLPLARRIILTRFTHPDQGMPLAAAAPEKLAAVLADLDFHAVTIAPDVATALTGATHEPNESPLIVTGSLYLLAEVYPVIEAE